LLLCSLDILETHFRSFHGVSSGLREEPCSLELLDCKIFLIVNNLVLVFEVILFGRIIDDDIFFSGRIGEILLVSIACEHSLFDVIRMHNSNLN
jgi:hypothetical protein